MNGLGAHYRDGHMSVKLNAWETPDDEHTLLALAGHSTYGEFQKDRKQRARELLQWCDIDRDKIGFEIGSGEGTVASLISPKCRSLHCNDISDSFLARARITCALCNNLLFFKVGADYLEHLKADFYDFGFALNVFIHFNHYDLFNYLRCVRRILRRGGRFYFDACTLGPATIEVFREHARDYRRSPENVRGLLGFNDPNALRTMIAESGLRLSETSVFSPGGWLKVLVTKS
jgi:SAM-dependent methyltransferase